MLEAVAFAAQCRWQTAPNPPVGALLVREGRIVARGRHEGAGLPHAEAEALADARRKGVDPAACTLVVTLTPCNHHGKTPPCTEAILAAGIRRVLVGAPDPNPEAAGGLERLRAAGVLVETGVAESECLDLIDNFRVWQTTDLPYTVLKLAATLDGRIATRAGHSRWITSPETRRGVHELRRCMQAVIIGGNTFYQDNPRLTSRREGEPSSQPLAVVVSSRLPEAGAARRLLRERPESTLFWTAAAAAASPRAKALRRLGVRVIGLGSDPRTEASCTGARAGLNLAAGLAFLRRELGCFQVLCEGGGRLALSLLEKGLVHEFHLHLAPKILGDAEAVPLFSGRAPLLLNEALPLRILETRISGGDILITLRPGTDPAKEA
ncbi:MAG: bifunctional diaminohydroxyphosphoribosylaminopyrimidine deaminase/5-amino-6-(5-phosphoribosylamino)uracil reductase RibD [Desulfovibrio sp.]|nr:bifunctional diaminohydroxyphosphoribosylaminopyrimidine deaminase/5-amino-6-(5-phosphoribosylamino)uracil reductase RibD [Desulfovibrio sp.]